MRLGSLIRSHAWPLLRDTGYGFFEDNALSRGASIAFYTVFSMAPILLIAIAGAGLFFGYDSARGAVVSQLSGLMGSVSASALQSLLEGARYKGSGVLATGIGVVTLAITATGVFAELQSALNVIWRAEPQGSMTSAMLRVRLLSLGLVASLGFLLLVSLVISAALTAASTYLTGEWAGAAPMLKLVSDGIAFLMITVLFAAIYKVLPDREIAWADVAIGALVTACLFSVGKYLITLYIAKSAIASSYGSAGSVLVILLWIYYSAQIFLFGAEFTRVYAERRRGGAPPPLTPISPETSRKAS